MSRVEPAGVATSLPQPEHASRRAVALGAFAFAAVFVACLTWAKWFPYTHKLPVVAATHSLGRSILTGKAALPPAPSWSAATGYAVSYASSIWPALVAGLLIAAALEAFLPSRLLLAVFQRHRGQPIGALAGCALALPSMMCTCCAAPIAISARRHGVPVSSALANWLSNPVLNPAALAFMAFVLPWQFVAVRVVTGLVLVLGVTLVVGRMFGAEKTAEGTVSLPGTDVPPSIASAGRRFAVALGRLSVRLLPEYLVVVLLLGGFRGWLFPAGHEVAAWGLAAVLLFAVVGTLFVIPTAGEVPIIQGLLAAGVGTPAAGALVLTLPALSLPSMLMVRRSFPPRAILATAAAVVVMGVMGAGLLVLLT